MPWWHSYPKTKVQQNIEVLMTKSKEEPDEYLGKYDKASEGKPYLTGSQITTMCECPVAYRKRYIERLPAAPSSSIAFGLSGHFAENDMNLRQKIFTKKDVPLDVVQDAFNDKIKDFRPEIAWSKQERKFGTRKSFRLLQDEGIKTMKRVHLDLLPDIKPVSVEETIRIVLKDFPIDIYGCWDVETNRDILDFKFRRKTPNQTDVDRNLGLTIYAMAKSVKDGRPPRFVKLIGGVRLKSGPKAFNLRSRRTDDDFRRVLLTVAKIKKIIDNDIWLPASALSWKCSVGFCEYFKDCTERIVK